MQFIKLVTVLEQYFIIGLDKKFKLNSNKSRKPHLIIIFLKEFFSLPLYLFKLNLLRSAINSSYVIGIKNFKHLKQINLKNCLRL